ncbi:hypothetical protein [Streptomyces gardneri]|uniref:Secreted protein n=1 Tax=Streptomyces gardneri TaxID=66892 RepID=A0A4Y3RQP5_9ACTN|nr:hypothetical protein [Streptomyces gardneri]GEB59669.1 hypothetical protein SGA01_52740 [Streptomyces gardneri]GHG94262.1 hypothetical protein GCM10017674_24630 [Streptomyces gardneri]
MRHTLPLRRTLTAVLTTTLLAGGVLLGQTAAAEPAAAARITCNIDKLRSDAHKERTRAAQLRGLGAMAEARKAAARADALERRAQQCHDAENNNRPPLWK